MDNPGIHTALPYVLIETYWNVNRRPAAELVSEPSINRNILECKGDRAESDVSSPICINRNILECKDNRSNWLLSGQDRINRNILECKA